MKNPILEPECPLRRPRTGMADDTAGLPLFQNRLSQDFRGSGKSGRIQEPHTPSDVLGEQLFF
ncbi:MAG: hypothetical protein WC897_03090 [Candidatus Gracilibacteria bacterium]